MDRRRFLLTALVAAAVAAPAAAQVAPTVKGSRDDLRGAKRVYVDTSYDRALGEAVSAEIKKELPGVELVDAPERADLVVRFSRSVADERRGHEGVDADPPYSADKSMSRTPPPLRRMPLPAERTAGDEPEAPDAFAEPSRFALGSVLRPTLGGPMREAVSFRQPIRTSAESSARDFVRRFAKEYRKANPAP